MKNLPFNIYSGTRRATFALVVAGGGLAGCSNSVPYDPAAAAAIGGALGAAVGEAVDPDGSGAYIGGVLGAGIAREASERQGRCQITSNTRFDPVTGRVLGGSGNQRCEQTGPYEGMPAGRLGLPTRRNYFVEPEVQKDDIPDVWLGM